MLAIWVNEVGNNCVCRNRRVQRMYTFIYLFTGEDLPKWVILAIDHCVRVFSSYCTLIQVVDYWKTVFEIKQINEGNMDFIQYDNFVIFALGIEPFQKEHSCQMYYSI